MLRMLCLCVALAALPAAAVDLITDEEARLPKEPFSTDSHAVGRGPQIRIAGPKKSEPSAAPFGLQIRFQAYGGRRIDETSIRVIYFSKPRVDITARLLPHLREGMIDLPDANVPAGQHSLEISVRDSEGYERTTIYEFSVEKF